MEWLTLWLKKIILLVLLAAFLDLILPNTNMQRYVKMVMGLIILITIISPVFSLFHLSQEELALRLDRYQQQLDNPKNGEWQSLADKLLGQQKEQMTLYVQKQMEAAVRAQVKTDFGLETSDVHIHLKADGQDAQQAKIASIQLTIGEQKQEGEAISGIKPIVPVQPVVINPHQTGQLENAQEQNITGQKSTAIEAIEASGQAKEPVYRQIAQSIARQWDISPDQVIVNDEASQVSRQ